MYNKKRTFKGFLIVSFYIGVNVIGLPLYHHHKLALYKLENK